MSAPAPPTPLRVAAALVAVEAAGAVAAGAWIEVGSLREQPSELALALSSGVLLLLWGAGLLLVAWHLARGRRWTRGPVVATQLLALLMSSNLASGPARPLAFSVGAVCIAILVLMFLPASTALFRQRTRDGDGAGDGGRPGNGEGPGGGGAVADTRPGPSRSTRR